MSPLASWLLVANMAVLIVACLALHADYKRWERARDARRQADRARHPSVRRTYGGPNLRVVREGERDAG